MWTRPANIFSAVEHFRIFFTSFRSANIFHVQMKILVHPLRSVLSCCAGGSKEARYGVDFGRRIFSGPADTFVFAPSEGPFTPLVSTAAVSLFRFRLAHFPVYNTPLFESRVLQRRIGAGCDRRILSGPANVVAAAPNNDNFMPTCVQTARQR